MNQIKRSDLDANPPEHVKKQLEERMAKLRSRREDRIPETFIGKANKGYILKNLVIHRGRGSPKVS